MSYPAFARVVGYALIAALALLLTSVVPAVASLNRKPGPQARTASKSTKPASTTTAPSGTSAQRPRSSGGAGLASSQKYPGDSKHLGDRILREGMRGHDVRVLQNYLTIAGFPVEVSGVFGPVTKKRVEQFQSSVHLSPDGIVTLTVSNVLRHVVAKVEASLPQGTTRINGDGTATAPRNSPIQVQEMVSAANSIINKPYCYGGGHGTWYDSCYDCSGSVSFVLHAAGLLSSPEDSSELESWGVGGKGKWVTVYANPNHTWIVIAGRAFDTADFGGPDIPGGSGPRWRYDPTGNFGDGESYVVRHPAGL